MRFILVKLAMLLASSSAVFAVDIQLLKDKLATHYLCEVAVQNMQMNFSTQLEFDVDENYYSAANQDYRIELFYMSYDAWFNHVKTFYDNPRKAEYDSLKWDEEVLDGNHWQRQTVYAMIKRAIDGDFDLADNIIRKCVDTFDLDNRNLINIDYTNIEPIRPPT